MKHSILLCILGALALFAISYGVFRKFNKGLARNSCGQQFRRYLIGSILAFVPAAVAGMALDALPVAAAALTSFLWIFTLNVLYDWTYRSSSSGYDNHIDIAFGIYLFGWLTGLGCLIACVSPVAAGLVMAVVQSALMIVPVLQIGYYIIYGTCIDTAGMQVVLETNGNEILEFVRSFSLPKFLLMLFPLLGIVALSFGLNLHFDKASLPLPALLVLVGITAFFTVYIWKRKHGLFVRTGIVMLYHDIKEYKRSNKRYRESVAQRFEELDVELATAPTRCPHTIMLVIGESGCRDYMSAFTPQPWETTPWQSRMKGDAEHFLLFPNAYSCAMQTVPSLEKALTEKNLYNDKDFLTACSIVDIAHKAGYRVHWYSNQGHIGSADTPVTLVADTADTAKWTKQEIGKPYYDSTLLEFLHEVDPTRNNFVVMHLKGNHFNYTNRYTPEYAAANGLTDGDDVRNYMNSIHYTDHILRGFFEYATRHLNLQAMIHFSDHGAMPDTRRSPRFLGFGMVRIPLWIYVADEYKALHPEAVEALRANREKYFTNDLAYELVCGILGVRSAHYDDTASLASPGYRFTRDMLLTDDGRVKVSDDAPAAQPQ